MKSNVVMLSIVYALYTMAAEAVVIKAPTPTTIPFRAKVYGMSSTLPFEINDAEKPILFKPFDSIVTDYSWKYISKARPGESGYVLLGYNDKAKAAALESAAIIFDPVKNQLTGLIPDGTPLTTSAIAPVAPSPSIAPTTPQASVVAAVPKAPTTSQPAVVPSSSAQKQLLFEVNVLCTNIPGVPLRKKQINNAIPNGKVYGSSFNIKNNKNCYAVAKKYKEDAPAHEMQEFIEKMYGGMLGIGGALR